MQKFRADYKVKADLVRHPDSNIQPVTLSSGHEIVFINSDTDECGNFTHMTATVIGICLHINEVANSFRTILASALDILSFATQSRFQILAPMMVVEWGENMKERRMKVFKQKDFRDPPEPMLQSELIETMKSLDASGIEGYVRTALKYFRFGLLEASPEDQFMRFWMALEVIAENTKVKEKEILKCQKCGGDYCCSKCNTLYQRVPMAKKQIKELIVGLLGEAEGKLITKKLFVTRDGLMHGGSIENIEKKVGLSIEELVNQIGYITNELLMHQFKAIAGEELVFGYISNSFVNKTLSASVNLMINSESHTYPSEEELSGIKISINSGFK